MKVGQNRDLYEVFVALSVSPQVCRPTVEDRVAVEQAIRDRAVRA